MINRLTHPGQSGRKKCRTKFQYDGNGNLTNDGRRVLEYDFENQLTNVYVASGWRSEFQYDAFGRQRVRREYTWSSGAWLLTNETRLVYDGMLVVQERDANNLAQVRLASQALRVRCPKRDLSLARHAVTRGNDLSGSLQGAGGIGGLLARTDNSLLVAGAAAAHAYYHCDGNGNVTALVSTNGIMLARYSYDPYGNLLGMSGPLAEANRYRFSSKEWNGNAGLYYYGYRFYDGGLQRWLNRDPIEEDGGINLYEFGLSAPINWSDPYGRCPLVLALPAIGGAGEALGVTGLAAAGTALNTQKPSLGWDVYFSLKVAQAIPVALAELVNWTKSWDKDSPNPEKTGKRLPRKNRPDGKRTNDPRDYPDPKPPKPPKPPEKPRPEIGISEDGTGYYPPFPCQ